MDDALFTAVEQQNIALAEDILVKNGGNMSKDSKYIDSIGLMHMASRLGHAAMVDLLLIYGFDYCGKDRANAPIDMICEDACPSEEAKRQIRLLLDFSKKREPCEYLIQLAASWRKLIGNHFVFSCVLYAPRPSS